MSYCERCAESESVILQQEATIATLTAERDGSRKAHDDEAAAWQLLRDAAEAEVSRLRGELDDLRKYLARQNKPRLGGK